MLCNHLSFGKRFTQYHSNAFLAPERPLLSSDPALVFLWYDPRSLDTLDGFCVWPPQWSGGGLCHHQLWSYIYMFPSHCSLCFCDPEFGPCFPWVAGVALAWDALGPFFDGFFLAVVFLEGECFLTSWPFHLCNHAQIFFWIAVSLQNWLLLLLLLLLAAAAASLPSLLLRKERSAGVPKHLGIPKEPSETSDISFFSFLTGLSFSSLSARALSSSSASSLLTRG